jgi:hypothetical protein
MLDRGSIKFHVDRHLRSALDVVPAGMRESLEGVLQERSLLMPDPAPYFEPLGHPLFELPVWVASRLGDEGTAVPEEVVSNVLGISALGYLHVRAQDDWLDASSREDPGLVALAEALMALSSPLLATVVGSSPRFWAFYAEVMTAYAGSLLRTEELRKGAAPVLRADFEQLLAQSRPLAIPTAALLDRADRWDLLGPLEEFVFAATAASQLVNDLTDLYRDRTRGHRTWTLEVVGASEADRLWTEVAWSTSEQAGRLQERIGEALSFHERSARAAHALAPTVAESWIADRRARLEGLLGDLRGNLLTAFIGRLTRPAGRAEQLQEPREETAQ